MMMSTFFLFLFLFLFFLIDHDDTAFLEKSEANWPGVWSSSGFSLGLESNLSSSVTLWD